MSDHQLFLAVKWGVGGLLLLGLLLSVAILVWVSRQGGDHDD